MRGWQRDARDARPQGAVGGATPAMRSRDVPLPRAVDPAPPMPRRFAGRRRYLYPAFT